MVNLREFGFDFDLRMQMITNFIDPHHSSNVLEINMPSPTLEREVNEGFVLALPFCFAGSLCFCTSHQNVNATMFAE